MKKRIERETDENSIASRYPDVEPQYADLPHTDDGQPLAITESLSTGSKQEANFHRDKYQFDYNGSFGSCSNSATTFHTKDIKSFEKRAKFRALFLLNDGRAHPDNGKNGYWEEFEHRTRQSTEFKHNRADALLSQADAPKWVRHKIRDLVARENLNGFSRYYDGVDGAALGLATIEMHGTLEEAKQSHLREYAEEEFDFDWEKLVEYVWRTRRETST